MRISVAHFIAEAINYFGKELSNASRVVYYGCSNRYYYTSLHKLLEITSRCSIIYGVNDSGTPVVAYPKYKDNVMFSNSKPVIFFNDGTSLELFPKLQYYSPCNDTLDLQDLFVGQDVANQEYRIPSNDEKQILDGILFELKRLERFYPELSQ